MKTIVVDDEPLMLAYFADASKDVAEIEEIGRFRNPLAVMDFIRANQVELVFLDQIMPKLTGVELAAQIRRYDPTIKVIFITADDSFQAPALMDNLADACLSKPYSTRDLREAIISACKQRIKVAGEPE